MKEERVFVYVDDEILECITGSFPETHNSEPQTGQKEWTITVEAVGIPKNMSIEMEYYMRRNNDDEASI